MCILYPIKWWTAQGKDGEVICRGEGGNLEDEIVILTMCNDAPLSPRRFLI